MEGLYSHLILNKKSVLKLFKQLSYIQSAAEWTPIFQREIKMNDTSYRKKALYFRKVLTIQFSLIRFLK